MRFVLHRAGVVVNDFPTVREALPHQREYSGYIILFAFQVPSPEHECRVRPQKPKLQFRKTQLSLRVAVWIVLLSANLHPHSPARHPPPPTTTPFPVLPSPLLTPSKIHAP